MALKDFPKTTKGFYKLVKGLMNWHEPLNENVDLFSAALDNKAEKPGSPVWFDLPLIAPYAVANPSDPVQYCKIGNIVYLRGRVCGIDNGTPLETVLLNQIARLPAGFRPLPGYFSDFLAPSNALTVTNLIGEVAPNGYLRFRGATVANENNLITLTYGSWSIASCSFVSAD